MNQTIFDYIFGSEPMGEDGLKKRFELIRTKRTQLLEKLAEIAKADPTVDSFLMLVGSGAMAMDDALASMVSRLVEERNVYRQGLTRHIRAFGEIDPAPFSKKRRHIVIQRIPVPVANTGDTFAFEIQYDGEVMSVYHDRAANQIVLTTIVTNDEVKYMTAK